MALLWSGLLFILFTYCSILRVLHTFSVVVLSLFLSSFLSLLPSLHFFVVLELEPRALHMLANTLPLSYIPSHFGVAVISQICLLQISPSLWLVLSTFYLTEESLILPVYYFFLLGCCIKKDSTRSSRFP